VEVDDNDKRSALNNTSSRIATLKSFIVQAPWAKSYVELSINISLFVSYNILED
jgi:hypothetical protein